MNCYMKNKLTIGIFMFLIGIAALVYGIVIDVEQSAFITGFGSGLGGTALVLIIKTIRDYSNPERRKATEIADTDERNIKIMTNSYALAFRICLLLQALATIVLVFLKESDLALCLAGASFLEMVILIIIITIETKKN